MRLRLARVRGSQNSQYDLLAELRLAPARVGASKDSRNDSADQARFLLCVPIPLSAAGRHTERRERAGVRGDRARVASGISPNGEDGHSTSR
jgi:hypothetical protein